MHEQMRNLVEAYRDVMTGSGADGIRVTIERTLSFTNSTIRYGLRIERERQTSSGRPGKPTPIVLLVNNPDETPATMLRRLADLLDQQYAIVEIDPDDFHTGRVSNSSEHVQ